MARFENPRSILVTGASAGIGEALAVHYARPGVRLFLNGRDGKRLEAVAVRCRERGANASTWAGEVTDEAGLRAWIERCEAEAPLELVIANAGIATGSLQVSGLHRAARDSFAVNVTGVFNTVHPAIECMARRDDARPAQIAIMSSVMAYHGMARTPAYSTSKAAVKHYGEALRGALRHLGIGVSVICPGYVDSRMTAQMPRRMPFQVTAETAATLIARGLARDRGRITFPWQVRLLARIVLNLPGFLVDRLNRPWGVPHLERG